VIPVDGGYNHAGCRSTWRKVFPMSNHKWSRFFILVVATALVWWISFTDDGVHAEPPTRGDVGRQDVDVVQVWQRAGAEYGVMARNEYGSFRFRRIDKSKPGQLPAFCFKKLGGGTLNNLPAPRFPFGVVFLSVDNTDARLKELDNFEQLRALEFIVTDITDTGLKELANHKNLRSLSLRGTLVSDAGLKECANIKQIQSLTVWGTSFTDAGLKELANLKQLRSLGLSGTRIADAGLKQLSNLKQLQMLNLCDT
jgi:hypothetical protein